MAVLKPVLLFFAGARDALSRHSRSMILALTFDRLAVSIQSLLGVLCLKAFPLMRPSMPDPAVDGGTSGSAGSLTLNFLHWMAVETKFRY